ARFALEHSLTDLTLIRYNPRHPGAKVDVFPSRSKSSRSRIYSFKSTLGRPDPRALGDRFWIPSHADYYRYALSPAEMDGILISVNTSRELAELIAALERGPLSPEEEEHMEVLARLAPPSPLAGLASSQRTGVDQRPHDMDERLGRQGRRSSRQIGQRQRRR